METREINWKNFAEEDFEALQILFASGKALNSIPALTAQCIEKYQKHILQLVSGVDVKDVNKLRMRLPSGRIVDPGHNISQMFRFLHKNYHITADYDLRQNVEKVFLIYYGRKYPDIVESAFSTPEEIELCKKTISDIRTWCTEKETDILLEKSEEIDTDHELDI